MPPAVSVLMPVHNGGDFLRSALDSLRAQTLVEFEIVVIDDGSTDHTAKILAAWPDSRLRVLTLAQNQGEAAARNHGLAAARGEFIALLDADDLAHPERLATQAAYLAAHPQVGIVGAACEVIDAGGRSLPPIDSPAGDSEIRWATVFRHAFVHSLLMFRRDLFARDEVRYSAEFPVVTDYDWFTRALGITGAVNLPRRLGSLRRHSGSFCASHRAQFASAFAEVSRRYLSRALPDSRVSLEDLRLMQAMFGGGRAPGETLPLAAMRQAARCHADLLAAFQARYPDFGATRNGSG